MCTKFSGNVRGSIVLFYRTLFFKNVVFDKLVGLREGFKKKSEKVWSFSEPGGGGVSEGGKKTKLLF